MNPYVMFPADKTLNPFPGIRETFQTLFYTKWFHENNFLMCQYANVPITMRYVFFMAQPIGTLAH